MSTSKVRFRVTAQVVLTTGSTACWTWWAWSGRRRPTGPYPSYRPRSPPPPWPSAATNWRSLQSAERATPAWLSALLRSCHVDGNNLRSPADQWRCAVRRGHSGSQLTTRQRRRRRHVDGIPRLHWRHSPWLVTTPSISFPSHLSISIFCAATS